MLLTYYIIINSAPHHYRLAMHVFGALTTASTLAELDDMVQSVAVVFSSPSSGANVEKHFKNLQSWLQNIGTPVDVTTSKRDNENLRVKITLLYCNLFINTKTYCNIVIN